MAGTDLLFTEALANPIPALRKDTKPVKSFGSETNLAQSSNLLEQEISELGAEETRRLTSNIDLTRDLGKMMLKDAEGKNLLAIKEKELQAVHDRERKRIRDELGEKFYNSPDMQEFKKFADESADKMMFVPSQTTAPLLGVVFATIGATGMLLGGLSKNNAKAALSAMNGMAEGFGKGKEDLYKQERQTFDTNVKAMTQRMGILKAKLDVAREKMKYDADAADLEANAAFAEAGADFLKANKDKFGLQDSITKLETQIKQNETWAKLMATKKSDAIAKLSAEKSREHEKELDRKQQSLIQSYLEQGRQQRAAESLESRERQAASDRQTRSLIAQLGQQGVQPIGMADGQLMVMDKAGNISSRQLPEGFQGTGKLASGQKLSATKEKKIDGLNSITSGLDKLKKDFKPEYAGLGVFGFGADLELEAARRGLGKKEANDAARWWGRYNQYQAPNRHALFGATLTGNELKNYQSFTAKPSDSAQTVRGFIDDQINYSKDILDVTAPAGYKPKAKPEDYESTFGAPSPAPQPSAAQPSTGPYIDPDKERRYQDWKARQPK